MGQKFILYIFICIVLFSCKKENTNAPGTLPNSYSNQALGASAKDMLRDDQYNNITIQIEYMPGYPLDTATLSNVTSYLSSICNKPGGISITQTEIPSGGDTLNVTQVAIIESQYRTAYTSGNTLALYILVTDGYDTAANVLGFAYRCTSVCLFGKNIYDRSGGYDELTRIALESGVLEHELGHIMGLVNNTTPMVVPHQDTAHGYHCNNPNCLMYYEMETSDNVFGMLGANNIPKLDSNCMNDLAANGGK